jgi:hypothetical protein
MVILFRSLAGVYFIHEFSIATTSNDYPSLPITGEAPVPFEVTDLMTMDRSKPINRIVTLSYLQHSDPTIPYYRKVRLNMVCVSVSEQMAAEPMDIYPWIASHGRSSLVWVDRAILPPQCNSSWPHT